MGMSGSGVGLLNQSGGGYGSSSMRRVPPYVVRLADSAPLTDRRSLGTVSADFQRILTRSSVFNSNTEIQVTTEGSVVVLQGTVASARERRLAENMLRLSPGVRQVRNELQVREVAPTPRKTQ